MRLVNKAILGSTVAVLAIAAGTLVNAQSTPQPRKGSAENKLVGIALYDTGTKVVSVYGSPDEIQALNVGNTTGAGGGSGAGGGRGGAPSGGGSSNAPQVPSASGDWRGDMIGDPFGPGTEWRQARGPSRANEGGGDSGSAANPNEGRGGDGGGRASGGGVGGGGDKVIFTRWIYKRNNSRYAFVLDKFNRVIQIETIGLKNSAVKTRRGITFGSSFASIIKAYGDPDGYEINGDTVVVRYLVRDHVAFRLSRLDAKKPQVVTGVVVAAGKT